MTTIRVLQLLHLVHGIRQLKVLWCRDDAKLDDGVISLAPPAPAVESNDALAGWGF
ncbi:hypothetical protein IMZ48_22085 [Candidatus Bathyarchaeota archaeon]|nr:hypothetical protein [Candidatus Bathyarchaeota archaeon]